MSLIAENTEEEVVPAEVVEAEAVVDEAEDSEEKGDGEVEAE